MKIFGYEINRVNQSVNEAPKKGFLDIFRKTVKMPQSIYRVSQDIQKFKTAVNSAEEWTYPERYPLYQIYKNITLDAHLTSVMEQRKNLTLQNKFVVKDSKGEILEDKTKLIQGQWFYDFTCHALDSIFYGHSLIQFLDIVNREVSGVELVPREYVKPEYKIVTETWTGITGTSYNKPPFSDWVFPVGKDRDLGLLMKAAPLIIWKQSALGAWAEFQEVFGLPFRYMKTNILDEKTRSNAENMMAQFATSLSAIIDTNDEFNVQSNGASDSFRVFDEMINRVNSEISKLILNQTGTTDEKSYAGSAEVHERVLLTLEQRDMSFLLHILNNRLVPFLKNLGIDIGAGNVIDALEREPLSIEKKADVVVSLINSGKYKIEPDFIKENFNIIVEESEESGNTETIATKLKNLYQ